MPAIGTIARPRRNRISIAVPREYGSCSFRVILLPIVSKDSVVARPVVRTRLKKKTFVGALLSCPKLDDGETLDVSRDSADGGVCAIVRDRKTERFWVFGACARGEET